MKRVILSVIVVLVLTTVPVGSQPQPRIWPTRLTFVYRGSNLNKQSVTLERSCVPASTPKMCIDSPNFPNNFVLLAMGMLSPNAVEVHDVLLTFSSKVSWSVPGSITCWMPINLEGTEYRCLVDQKTAALAIEPFFGTPLPSPEMKVTVKVFYGNDSSQATFTLRVPR